MKKIKILVRITVVLVFLGFINACSTDDLEPSTEQNKTVETGITSIDNISGILKGAYNELTASGYYGRDYIMNNEVRSDNCFSNGNSGRFTTQASFNYDANTGYFWDDAYQVIANANVVIGVDLADLEGDPDLGSHIQGQAYALRALAHFDMLKQYGQQHAGGTLGVPYIMEFKGDDLYPSRNTITECISYIMADLTTAYGLMDATLDEDTEYFTKMAVKALEAKVATYFGMWPEALAASAAVINSGEYSIIPAANYVDHFGSDMSANSIFELAYSETDNAGINGIAYIMRTTGGGSYGDVEVIEEVWDFYEATDVRRDILGGENSDNEAVAYVAGTGLMLRNIGKFPDNQGFDNVVVIRYEEIILSYAEALLETGDAAGALTQLNLITSNRGASAYTVANKDNILDERRKEFMFEGMRFEDLTRAGKDIEKLYFQQNFAATLTYPNNLFAYPIPNSETDANSNMVQNNGY